jgi:hypothetical protein
MRAFTKPGDAGAFAMAVDMSHDLALLGSLRGCLDALGVRAELREHLISLVVFRVSPGLPVCVFVSEGRFYCWDNGLRREHITRVDRVAAELAELASGFGTGPTASVPCRPEERTKP